jgi:protein phosphatase 1L
MAKNLRLAMESQRKERPINTKPNSFMTPLETVGFDGKLAESELEQLKKDKLVPVYQDVQITRNCDRRCYFAMSPLLTEGRLQIGAAHTKGSRQFMEDRHLSSANLMLPFPSGDEHALLAGVFDGHGGEEFANYLADHLPQYFLAQFNAMKTKSHDRDVIIYNALKQAIVMAGRDCDRDRFLLSGATVACSLIIGDTLYVANLGDSRTIYLPVSGAPIQLSDDAKETPRFTKRVVNRGGVVLHRAVGGQIRCFGACGDLALKTDRDVPIMPQRAQITTHKIAPGGTLIIASDGLWDVATTEEVAAITSEIRSRIPANKIALNIVQRAFLARSQDNITVVVINV